MRRIALLGSTGSIGTNTLQVAKHLGDVEVVALAAGSNIDLLEQQVREWNPEVVAVYNEEKAKELQRRLPNQRILPGMEGLEAVATVSSANFVVSAIAGTLGLKPTLAAIQAGKDVGLANKEALVSGGALVMALAKEKGVNILPIDSEHSAIFQCFEKNSVQRIILTASGGPFREYSLKQLEGVTVKEALNHPTWKMGPKVTIDSSTLMNKGLEVIEAHWLFGMPIDQIDVVIHPQSIIHSMVEYVDNSIIAQMGVTDMKIPIQYAMTYPERRPGLFPPFDFAKNGKLEFFTPDSDKFRCLRLACEAVEEGGTFPCYMNAANEVLVDRFLNKEISWLEIGQRLEALMDRHKTRKILSLECVFQVDTAAREEAAIV